MATVKFIGFLIILAFVAIFTFQNTDPVKLNFLFLSKEMSLSLMLLGFLFAGIIIGWVFSLVTSIKKDRNDDDLKSL